MLEPCEWWPPGPTRHPYFYYNRKSARFSNFAVELVCKVFMLLNMVLRNGNNLRWQDGLEHWLQDLYMGADMVLTSAFHEQFPGIGWFHMCLIWTNRKWSSAIWRYTTPNMTKDQGDYLASIMIRCLWRYAKSLWNQNMVVHGNTAHEQAHHLLDALLTQVR